MKLGKQIAIFIAIILFIVFLDIIFEQHFSVQKNKFEELVSKIQELILNKENAKQDAVKLYDDWQDFEAKAAYYVEHNELEKVSSKVGLIKKTIEIDETDLTVEYLEEIKFLLDHIYDKDKLRLKNIF
ncbi:MAG: DUF4363 family protein [Clostridia bacterium]|nr:DUF4363 family protein [Clostridia bacterium]